jgi:hypothetical protein
MEPGYTRIPAGMETKVFRREWNGTIPTDRRSQQKKGAVINDHGPSHRVLTRVDITSA